MQGTYRTYIRVSKAFLASNQAHRTVFPLRPAERKEPVEDGNAGEGITNATGAHTPLMRGSFGITYLAVEGRSFVLILQDCRSGSELSGRCRPVP